MSIDYAHFTPWACLVGGLLIGLSASLYVLGLGRIAGIAGIVGTLLQGLTRGSLRGQAGRLWFLLGIVSSFRPRFWNGAVRVVVEARGQHDSQCGPRVHCRQDRLHGRDDQQSTAATASAWPRLASSPLWVAEAMATTTRWPKRGGAPAWSQRSPPPR